MDTLTNVKNKTKPIIIDVRRICSFKIDRQSQKGKRIIINNIKRGDKK